MKRPMDLSLPKREQSRQAQVDKFREAARELGCDESEERFDATLERIAKAPPPKDDASGNGEASERD